MYKYNAYFNEDLDTQLLYNQKHWKHKQQTSTNTPNIKYKRTNQILKKDESHLLQN